MPAAAELAALRDECLRAFELIRTNQLALFADVSPGAADEHVARVDAALAASAAPLGPTSEPTGGTVDDELEGAAEALRALLRETLARYRDPYANYIDPQGHDAYARRRRGDLVGVGLKFRSRDRDYPLVLGPLLGGPLDPETGGDGVEPGDVLVSADGHDLSGLGATATRARLSGAEGSRVELGVRRGAEPIRTVAVRRRTVALHYARSDRLAGGVVHLRVSRFGTDTHERARALVEAAERDGATGYVLDLRHNPGGSTRAARSIVSLFDALPEIYCERLAGARTRRLPRHGEVLTRRPLAVLVDERSMSSSEIAAGALQHAGRARVVGAPTWGKGLIQKVHPLAAPLGGAVRLTIATFSTPDGRPLHARGIVPDVYVPSAPHEMFVESGSLNVSARTRAFRHELLLEDLARRLSAAQARAYAALPDTQLAVAIASLGGR